MEPILLQPWVTAHATANTVQNFVQDALLWRDIGTATDATLWVNVSDVVQATGSAGAAPVQLLIESSPSRDDSEFQPIVPPLSLTTSSPQASSIALRSVLMASTAPLARWVRWRLTTTGTSGSWGATLRIRAVPSRQSYFSPLQIPGCAFWARSDAGITTNSSNQVTQWSDQSGFGANATPSTGTQMAYSSSGGVNGLPFLTGTSSTFMTGAFASAAQLTLSTIVGVGTSGSQTVSFPGLFTGTNSSFGTNSGCSLVYATNTNFTARQMVNTSTQRNATLSGALTTNVLHIHLGLNDSSITTYYRDGISQVASSSISGNNTSTNFVIGSESNSTASSWIGQFYEFIAYNRVLSSTQLTMLHRYLGERYAIAVP